MSDRFRLKKWLTLSLCGVLGCVFAIGLPGQYHVSSVHAVDSSPIEVTQSTSAQALFNAGVEHYQAGRYVEAIAQWNQALDAYAAHNVERALTLSNLSLAHQHLGEWENAEMAIKKSLAFFDDQTEGSRTTLGWLYFGKALNAEGAFYWRQGNPEAAMESWKAATAAYKSADHIPGVIGSQINQAKVMQFLGLSNQAKEKLEVVQLLLDQQPNLSLKAMGLRHLGNALRRVGHLDESVRTLEESLDILESSQALSLTSEQRNKLRSATLLELGNALRAQWERAIALTLPKANDYGNRALASYQDAVTTISLEQKQSIQRIQAQTNLLGMMVDVHRLEQPIPTQYGDVLTLWGNLHQPDSLQYAFATLPLGRTRLNAQLNTANSLIQFKQTINPAGYASEPSQCGSDQSAFTWSDLAKYLVQLAQDAKQLGDRRSQSLALGYLGHIYEICSVAQVSSLENSLERTQWKAAQKLTQDAIALSESIQASDIQYRWEWQLGRVLKQQGKTSAAIDAYRQAVKTLAEVRKDLLFLDSDIQFSFRDNVEPVYRELVDLILQEPEPDQDALEAAVGFIDVLQLAELENFLDCDLSSTVELSKAKTGNNAAIFYAMILGDQSFGPNSQRLEVALKLPNQTNILHHSTTVDGNIAQTLDKLRYWLEQPYISDEVEQASATVYQWLIQPQEESLANSGVDTLVFVLDGILRNVPMAALRDAQGRYLIEQYAIALTPRLQLPEPKSLDPDNLDALFFGLSNISTEFRAQFESLPFVEAEALIVEKLFISSELRLNESFTNQRFREDIQGSPFSIIHFATHGEFSSEPENTFLLAWDTKIQSNDLRSILQTRGQLNPIDLLVLSACKTADGDNRATLGLAGIAFQAGAESTVASLWVINDEATSIFMMAFYEALTDTTNPSSRAKALQNAQQTLLADGYEPYYWAPFVLVGNWL